MGVSGSLHTFNIDIPVEIKSDAPVLVEIDNDDNWRKLREI